MGRPQPFSKVCALVRYYQCPIEYSSRRIHRFKSGQRVYQSLALVGAGRTPLHALQSITPRVPHLPFFNRSHQAHITPHHLTSQWTSLLGTCVYSTSGLPTTPRWTAMYALRCYSTSRNSSRNDRSKPACSATIRTARSIEGRMKVSARSAMSSTTRIQTIVLGMPQWRSSHLSRQEKKRWHTLGWVPGE